MPGSFLPEEDQGYALGDRAAAAGRDHAAHRRGACEQVRDVLEKQEGFDGDVRRSPASASSARARTSAWPSSRSSLGRAQGNRRREFIQQANMAAVRPDPRRADLRRQPADGAAASASSAASTCTCRTAPARAATRCRSAQSTLLGKAAQNKALRRRAPEHARADAPQLQARRRSRAGAGDGPVGRRHLQRDPADARAGLRQRLRLPAAACKRVTMQADAPFRIERRRAAHFYTPANSDVATAPQRQRAIADDDSAVERRARRSGSSRRRR